MDTRNKIILLVFGIIAIIMFGALFAVTGSQGQYISVPEYGFFACEQIDNVVSYPPTGYNSFSSLTFSCDQMSSGLNQDCTVVLKQPDGDTEGFFAGLRYRVCDLGQSCTQTNQIYYTEKSYVQQSSELGKTYNIPLTKNQYLVAEYFEQSITSTVTLVNKGSWKVNYKPFYIRVYDSRSQYTGSYFGSEGCIISSIPTGYEIPISVSGGGDLENEINTVSVANLQLLRNRDAVMPFITAISPVTPIGFDFFDNGNKYCRDYKVYQVERIDTPQGWYRIANTGTNKELYTVDCCNIADAVRKYGAGYTCSKDFKAIAVEVAECSIANPCPIVGKVPTSGSQVVFQECINNKCTTKYEGVPCAFSEDCPDGKFCEFDEVNPQNSKCVSYVPQNFCGNAVCDEGRGETYTTCPSDCEKPTPPFNWTKFLFILGLAIVGATILTLFIGSKLKGKVNNKKVVVVLTILIGLIFFVILFFVITVIVNGFISLYSLLANSRWF